MSSGFVLLSGVIDGLLFATLVVLTWSWYRFTELHVRVLAWVLAGRECLNFLPRLLVVGILVVSAVVTSIPSTIGSPLVSRPLGISWLTLHLKAWITRNVASSELSLTPAETKGFHS